MVELSNIVLHFRQLLILSGVPKKSTLYRVNCWVNIGLLRCPPLLLFVLPLPFSLSLSLLLSPVCPFILPCFIGQVSSFCCRKLILVFGCDLVDDLSCNFLSIFSVSDFLSLSPFVVTASFLLFRVLVLFWLGRSL